MKTIKITRKKFITVNITFAIVTISILLLFKLLELKESFIYGVLSGMLFSWIVIAYKFIKELKKPTHAQDERQEMIMKKAGSMTAFIFMVLALITSIVTASDTLNTEITLHKAALFCSYLFLSVYLITFFIYNKIH